ncbi:MAG TPA: hypothetical protein DDW67_07740 [Elusimicrobia bacterium]|nr:hypothetical protein [Elusimicrobiota bacterium]
MAVIPQLFGLRGAAQAAGQHGGRQVAAVIVPGVNPAGVPGPQGFGPRGEDPGSQDRHKVAGRVGTAVLVPGIRQKVQQRAVDGEAGEPAAAGGEVQRMGSEPRQCGRVQREEFTGHGPVSHQRMVEEHGQLAAGVDRQGRVRGPVVNLEGPQVDAAVTAVLHLEDHQVGLPQRGGVRGRVYGAGADIHQRRAVIDRILLEHVGDDGPAQPRGHAGGRGQRAGVHVIAQFRLRAVLLRAGGLLLFFQVFRPGGLPGAWRQAFAVGAQRAELGGDARQQFPHLPLLGRLIFARSAGPGHGLAQLFAFFGQGGHPVVLRVPGEFSSPQEINGATVGMFRGQAIKIGDIAQINDSHPYESEKVIANGRQGAILMVQKRSEANSIDVAEGVRKALPEIHRLIPSDIQIKPLIDTSADIKRTLYNLTETLAIAALLILGVIFVFLRRVRPAVIVFTSIPISLLDSFLVQYLAGYTINLISLLAITIAIGLVVDDTLVVMENQIRRQEELGEDSKTAAINAASEVGRAVTMATLASCVVFLPMMFADGMAGVMFKPLSIVMCATLLLSLMDSLTLNPMLSSLFLKASEGRHTRSGRLERIYAAFERKLVYVENSYKNLITWTLENPWKVVNGSIALLAVSLLLVPLIPTEFMSEQDSGQMEISVELPVGTRVEATHKVMERIEVIFKEVIPAEWISNGYVWRDGDNTKNSMGSMSGKSGSSVGTFNL